MALSWVALASFVVAVHSTSTVQGVPANTANDALLDQTESNTLLIASSSAGPQTLSVTFPQVTNFLATNVFSIEAVDSTIGTSCVASMAAAVTPGRVLTALATGLTSTTASFTLGSEWDAPVDTVRCLRVVLNGAGATYAGVKVKSVTPCDVGATAGPTACATGLTCCKSAAGFGIGQCINPQRATCCGSLAVIAWPMHSRTATQPPSNLAPICCGNSVISTDPTKPCACTTSNDCPMSESCCTSSKFTELPVATGKCYRSEFHQCCDDGTIYDPGQKQCCPVDGVIDRSSRCSCDDDADCNGSNAKCCVDKTSVNTATCDKYQVYPDGTAASVKCSGKCMDNRFELCCSGPGPSIAMREYERCCNMTTYNVFNEDCVDGRMNGNSLNDFRNFREIYQMKTETEAMTIVRAFWIFVLPTMLLFGSFAALAMIVVFSNKASNRDYSNLEFAIALLSMVVFIFALPLYFSPAYKYGLVFVLCALVSILTAAARIKLLNTAVVLVQLLVLFYIFDPFAGNQVASFGAYRATDTNAVVARRSAGVFQTLDWMARKDFDFCTDFYDYFEFDTTLRDTVRFDNPEVETFGYCTRSWVFALLMFTAIATIAMVLLFVFTNTALLLRFRKLELEAPVTLEIVQNIQ